MVDDKNSAPLLNYTRHGEMCKEIEGELVKVLTRYQTVNQAHEPEHFFPV